MKLWMMIFVLLIGQAFANFSTSLSLRNQIEVTTPDYIVPAKSIVLPVSPGLHQGMTSLCWTFTTLSLLESHYMYKNPEAKDVSFSRAHMQRNNAEERALRTYVLNTDVFMERGDLPNAIAIIQKYGIFPKDNRNYIDGYESQIKRQLQGVPTSDRGTRMTAIVDGIFFPLEAKVVFNGKEMSPKELGKIVLDDTKFTSFAFAPGARGEWRDHPDTDAFSEFKAWFVDPSKKALIIRKALEAGYGLGMGYSGHEVLIYGADYDDAGNPVKYYIKDSYNHGAGFTYESSAEETHKILWLLETLDIHNEI